MLNADPSAIGPTRYQMLESLRHYARERLNATGAADEVRRRHARHFAAAAAEISAGWRGPDEVFWLRRLEADLDNLRAAVTWALDSAVEVDGEFAMVILGEIIFGVRLLTVRNSILGGADEQAVELAKRSASPYASPVLAGAAINAYYRGDFRGGRERAREAMRRVRATPYPAAALTASFVFVNPKDLAAELTAALQILDEVGGDTWDYAYVRGVAAAMAAALGNVELAQREAAVALEMSRRLDNQFSLIQVLYALGLSSWQTDPVAAQAALEEHLQIARATAYESMMARVLALLAQLQARRGHPPAAVGILRDAVERAHIDGDRPALAVCLARGAVVMGAVGELETAGVFWGAVTDGVFARLTVLPPNEIPGHDRFMVSVQAQLGDSAYTAATARGAAMTHEQITTFTLAAVERLCPSEELRQGKNNVSSPAVD
jgi:hypothetical protein